MNNSWYSKIILAASFGGFIFSGYLSAVKLFTSTCALSEPCPYFLGYPACWYGFVMFLILFVSSMVGFLRKTALRSVAQVHLAVTFVGILFAGRFTIPEVVRLISGEGRYTLGLPTCAYGLVFYMLLCVVASLYLYRQQK